MKWFFQFAESTGGHYVLSLCITAVSGQCIHWPGHWQRQIQHRHAGDVPPPPFGIFWGFVFVNFDWITCVFFNWSHQTIFTMCTLFSPITTKHKASVKGVSKQTSDPKNSTPPRPCLLVLKFLDLPLTVLSTATVHVL